MRLDGVAEADAGLVEQAPHPPRGVSRVRVGGTFVDRSGGLITFEIGSSDEAERLVSQDPFVGEGSWRAPGCRTITSGVRRGLARSVSLCSRGAQTPAYADPRADLAFRKCKSPLAETT